MGAPLPMANPAQVDRRAMMALLSMEVTVRRLFVLIGVLIGIPAGLVLGVGSAGAEPPLRLADRVTDRAGVLSPEKVARVQDAVEQLRAENGVDLFVVFVRSFDGADGQEWADETARRSQLGTEDALLAVAVGDRAYGISVADGFPIDESRVDEIRTEAVEPRLSAEAWDGAAIAMADGLRSSGGGGFGLGLAVVGGAAVVGAGAYALHRRRRRAAEAPPAPDLPPDEFADVSTADLAYRASAALIEVDDAVRTSEQELAAARTHFGADAVAAFAAALDQSRADMMRAFTLRQQLDDDQPEDERATRAMNAEIIRIAAAADDRLDEQVEAFDALRGLEARAPEYVGELRTRLDGVRARLPQVDAAWEALQLRYAATALEPVAGDVDRARELLTAAEAELVEAQESVAGSGPAAAVVAGRAAEDAITQAETLLDGIGRRESELADAAEKVPAARAEVQMDLAEARALSREAIAPVVARAEAAVTAADQAAAGPQPDPIAALRLLVEAGTALDQGIADAREDAERDRKAAAALEQAVLTARSSVSAAEDFVATRRGAIRTRARTRLAEARRHLEQAGGADPVAALREAQHADALAREALALAQADVSQWSPPGATSSAGVDLAGLVLGGILSGATSSYRGHRRGGGGFSPGSFGGSASRGRRGGGGRF
ncbi:TPM domain-containing protein [Pseudonocardia cypriaca]|uniref:TLP18.3/Psb32/MOLO-1 phosphatase superfamily protein n=1 Tax=Pseudonocardia cypriaca TaxID=882449 RepID=A0A543FPI6_9PSEU|nr:TPM domain-containing protein [Pseudonocardia cypriaca]TQM35742.1 TLP18.3/Psb32/MOLO-1 phosphatase superfamily protein [Pseudonocardia cypriaca]